MPWLSELFGSAKCLSMHEKINDGETLKDFFCELARKNLLIQENVFDQSRGEFHDQIIVVINNKLVPPPQALFSKLSDGDIVVILPPIAGG